MFTKLFDFTENSSPLEVWTMPYSYSPNFTWFVDRSFFTNERCAASIEIKSRSDSSNSQRQPFPLDCSSTRGVWAPNESGILINASYYEGNVGLRQAVVYRIVNDRLMAPEKYAISDSDYPIEYGGDFAWVWSPDSSKVAAFNKYSDNSDIGLSIVILSNRGEHLETLHFTLEEHWWYEVFWSAAGLIIVSGNRSPLQSIYLYDFSTYEIKLLMKLSTEVKVIYNEGSDGCLYFFEKRSSFVDFYRISVFDITTLAIEKEITVFETPHYFVFSANNTSMAYVNNFKNHEWDLYIIDIVSMQKCYYGKVNMGVGWNSEYQKFMVIKTVNGITGLYLVNFPLE